MPNLNAPNYIDLFAGCGGLSLGLHNAGWKGVFAIEKSPDAFKTLKHNLIDHKRHFDWPEWLPQENHDVNQILRNYKKQLAELKGTIDLVAGGPPCQGFSMAGRRDESDSRNQLVKSYIKFIRNVMPKVIFFENVKGFTQEFSTNKDKGKKYVNYVESALTRAGYQVKGMLVNFGDFGIPQKRTRFILVGVRKDVAGKDRGIARRFFDLLTENKYSFLDKKGINVNTNLSDAISDIMKSNGVLPSPDTKNFDAGFYAKNSTPFQKLMRKDSFDIVPDSHRFVNHKEAIVSRFKVYLEVGKRNKDLSKELRERYDIKKHTIIPLDGNDKSPTITTLPDDYIHYKEPRILTVREYARIQSFPDWYAFQGKYTTGGKQRTKEVPRYSQIGNAIPPLFAEQSGVILKRLLM
ncbi:DNA cytosine methyltransferase [Pedobacter hiemivivus]|uniref:Cytosine-specific methyltransferase n=1 Tax=Pedobacter hiemivivus TaxID=2530454 RepID=A0A4R0NA95_9SPHI|nr:DNA cytosine methyltransferase [Pedobacter hiemivivus]TCC97130.1 DNA cytosine methyltransferase [Pedobacter hiemivivus]